MRRSASCWLISWAETITSPKAELFYWVTIMFSQPLGTALGDWTADSAGLGYVGSAIVFTSLLAAIYAFYFWTSSSRTLLFSVVFILTRPLALFSEISLITHQCGGLALSRYTATAVLLAFCAASILIFPQRASNRAH